MADFISSLSEAVKLTPMETAILRVAGVTSSEELDSLIGAFPSLAEKAKVRIPLVSAHTTKLMGMTYAGVAADVQMTRRHLNVARGAAHPPKARWAPGEEVPLPLAGAGAPPPPSTPPSGAIVTNAQNWAVRDQGTRLTCVAFASAACAEMRNTPTLNPTDLSEQFLFAMIKTKTGDPRRHTEATRLEYARDALQSEGICEEQHWPYNKTPISDNISQCGPGVPSDGAVSDAATHKFTNFNYQVFQGHGHGAPAVLAALQNGPVAVTLPVFKDPLTASDAPNNWTTPVAWAYGRVINPPPTAKVADGHAVCIVGFVPDSSEPKGGYFIFRNSWDVAWGSNAPSPGNGYSPARGYGDVSATYVDDYLWELLHL